MKRWFHRLHTIFTGLARLLGVLLHAMSRTVRERRTTQEEPARVAQPVPRQAQHPGAPSREIALRVDGATIHLPHPSVWPAVVGLGTAVMLFGIATSLGYSVAGFLVLLLGLGGWIGELHQEAAGGEGGDGHG